jgi:uncharacterized phage protein gp47/JayE
VAYIKIPLETNQSALSQEMFDYIVSQAPGWAPQDGNLDTWIIRAVAQVASDNRNVASDIQDDIFRYFGSSLMGIQPLDATSAIGYTTWNLTDSLGHTIPAGTTVGISDLNGNLQAFQVVSDVVVPNGSTATGSGAVVIRAVMPGANANNLGINGTPMQLIDVFSWVSDNGVVLTGPTVGGQEAETDSAYLNRLVTRLQRLSQRPILPADFSAMALDADPAVFRAVAIDGYNPADSSYNNQRMIAVASMDANGAASAAPIKANIDSYLQANREINFIVNVIDPKTTTINVVTTVAAVTGYTLADVQASVVSTIQGYLDPKLWGQDPTLSQAGASQTWVDSPTVYYNEMVTIISNVTGVSRVVSLTINGGTADVTMATPAALPHAGTITVTAVVGP